MIAMIAPATILGIVPLTYFRRVSYRFGLVFHALCELFGKYTADDCKLTANSADHGQRFLVLTLDAGGLGVVLSSNAVFFQGVCVGQFIISIGNGVVVILIYHSVLKHALRIRPTVQSTFNRCRSDLCVPIKLFVVSHICSDQAAFRKERTVSDFFGQQRCCGDGCRSRPHPVGRFDD